MNSAKFPISPHALGTLPFARAIFLRRYFGMQSYLSDSTAALSFGDRRRRQTLVTYAFVCLASLILQSGVQQDAARAFALGVAFPGAGFLYWTGTGGAFPALMFAITLAAFALALVIWFATGNMVLPPLVWFAAAFAAALPGVFGFDAGSTSSGLGFGLPAALAVISLGLRHRVRMQGYKPVPRTMPLSAVQAMEERDEIDLEELRRLRILLDRALQPIEQFQGFEQRDQFQTAALRYQLNFASYALSLARHRHLPAFSGYMREAQRRLLAKQGDPRIWSYWALENAWGNLRLDRDPIRRQNIMFSGFTLLQMALGDQDELSLCRRGDEWRSYSMGQIGALLAEQYRMAPYGLLACEPNWIYPLCNLITACGLSAADQRGESTYWDKLSGPFLESLAREFTDTRGNLVAFRSSLTGFAPPSPGGAVMQAFPCLFLNTIAPNEAEWHWSRLRTRLGSSDWRRMFWPIDVGNYGFTRASSFAASAAAAIEMGDGETARTLLHLLEHECPSLRLEGVIHHDRASLWAHSLELIARLGCRNGLRQAIEAPPEQPGHGPHLEDVQYPDVLVASAKRLHGETLAIVLQPGGPPVSTTVTMAGLRPNRHYRIGLPGTKFVQADRTGRAHVAIELRRRTSFTLTAVI